jgi:hypothetical protein
MPKIEIDYSNTIIYKITCKDPSIKDVYVGHTTNFVQRKHAHKQGCTNEKSPNYECKLYKVIRENGGWYNWRMEIIKFINCKDHYDARIKEQEYFAMLNATLNDIEPMPKPKENIEKYSLYKCKTCNITCQDANKFSIHMQTKKHLKKMNEPVSVEIMEISKNAEFFCKKCDFKCSKLCDWTRHINTQKHMYRVNGNIQETVEINKTPTSECVCGKKYESTSGLWKHKKICKKIKNVEVSKESEGEENAKKEYKSELEEISDKKLIMELLKSNNELQKQIIELCKEKNVVTNNNNCNNNNTNNFNLQFFLNEQCKDALNIMDFIGQLQMKLSDLDMVGRVGYSEGISKIFIRGLKELDVFKRPIHCSDLKREILYVKDKDSWEKDSDEKKKMKTAIKYIAAKNFKQINEWKEENPESNDYDTKKHMDYHQIIIQSMGGTTPEEDDSNYNKIIRNVAKESVIDKSEANKIK